MTMYKHCLHAACLLAAFACAPSTKADPIAEFYTGKTISLLLSVGEGDGMDKAARVIARHWSRHIPGNPAIIVRNMPGAGGLRVTNFLFNQAPKDGTAVAGIIPSFVRQQMLGGQGVDYDAAKFNWLGSSNTSNTSVFVWHTTGVTTLQQAMERELLMGATGIGSNAAHYPTILNNVIGTKFKIVMGYRASPAINLAVEQGEVHGRAGETFNTLMLNTPTWVRDGKINLLVQIGQRKEPGFEQVPMLIDFARRRGEPRRAARVLRRDRARPALSRAAGRAGGACRGIARIVRGDHARSRVPCGCQADPSRRRTHKRRGAAAARRGPDRHWLRRAGAGQGRAEYRQGEDRKGRRRQIAAQEKEVKWDDRKIAIRRS